MRLPDGRHLCYCTNVHPYDGLDGLIATLEGPARRVRERVGRGHEPFGIGLWFPGRVARAVADDPAPLRAALAAGGFEVVTLNAFPYGDFHGERVKDGVFRPAWDDPLRLAYTLDAAEGLAALLPDGASGSISTHTGGYKPWADASVDPAVVAANLERAARGLADVERRTGRRIVLALEPEPYSMLETTPEVVAFFGEHVAAFDDSLRPYLGVCFDACHQAVWYEDTAASLAALTDAGVPIAKIQLSSAIATTSPRAAASALAPFAEDRWFHQVVARRGTSLEPRPDLDVALADPALADADEWRVHFHVPLFAETLDDDGLLGTTRPQLDELLAALAADASTCHHLEIETYSFGMIPEARRRALGAVDVEDGIAREYAFVLDRLSD